MIFLDEYGKMPIGIKSASISIGALVPCFFVDVYLFKPEWIKNISGNPLFDMDTYFLICVCFFLAATWYLLNLALAQFNAIIAKLEDNHDAKNEEVFSESISMAILFLGAMTFVNTFLNLDFKTLIITCYISISSYLHTKVRIARKKREALHNKD